MCKRYGIANPTAYFGYDSSSHIDPPPHYADLYPPYRAAVDAVIETMFRAQKEAERQSQQQSTASKQEDNYKIITFRLSEQPASAGYGYDLGPENFSIIHVRDDGSIDPKTMYGVPITGDSMEPKYHDGDIVIIKQNVDVPFGEIGLFTVGTCGYFKKRAVGKLLSLNSKYDPIPTPDNEYFTCNGKVVDVLNPNNIVSE